jgi:CPA1 family monovalent cation:H+ antiporter
VPALWFGLACLILVGAALASRTPLPDPIVWVLLGLGVAFVPGVPEFRLDAHLALFLVLPPLVYSSAVQLPWPEFRENFRPIAVLAVGLVAASTVAVGFLAHEFAGLPWSVALALGAIVSPTDPVAASAVASRVGIPRRLTAILEGEGLVNDAVSLTVLRIALAAWSGASFSPAEGVLRFVAILVGEPLYGWVLGMGIAFLRARITDPQIEITVSLLTPFAAYLLPERLGGSGILATVAVGMYIGERSSTLVPAGTRLHATSFWQMIVFLLNGGLFLTAGMELRRVFASASRGTTHGLAWGLCLAAVVALVRIVSCGFSWYGLQALRAALGRQRRPRPLRHIAVIAWSGMRGPISLAAALSIPAAVGNRDYGDFETVLAVTAVVVVATLLGQGAALPALIKALGLSRDAAEDRAILGQQEALGRTEATRAALQRLSELESQGRVASRPAERLRRLYNDQLTQETEGVGRSDEEGSVDAIRSELIGAERARILDLRSTGRISDYALERLQRALDLRESLLD